MLNSQHHRCHQSKPTFIYMLNTLLCCQKPHRTSWQPSARWNKKRNYQPAAYINGQCNKIKTAVRWLQRYQKQSNETNRAMHQRKCIALFLLPLLNSNQPKHYKHQRKLNRHRKRRHNGQQKL